MKPREGSYFSIKLQDGQYAFGRVLKHPVCAFYDLSSDRVIEIQDIAKAPILFKIWVMDSAFKKANWRLMDHQPLEAPLKERVWCCKYDSISRAYSIYSEGEEHVSTRDACRELEPAAVWSADHVEDRLVDHFRGVPNKWYESLRVK